MLPNCVLLASFLRDTLRPEDAARVSSELASVPQAHQLHEEILALRRFILDVAAGELSADLHVKGYMAGVLKTLRPICGT